MSRFLSGLPFPPLGSPPFPILYTTALVPSLVEISQQSVAVHLYHLFFHSLLFVDVIHFHLSIKWNQEDISIMPFSSQRCSTSASRFLPHALFLSPTRLYIRLHLGLYIVDRLTRAFSRPIFSRDPPDFCVAQPEATTSEMDHRQES